MAYDAGQAFVQIVPSFKGFVDSINKTCSDAGLSGGKAFSQSFNDQVKRGTNVPVGPSDSDTAKQGAKSGKTFADSFKAQVDAALRSLPDVTVDADASPAEARIAELRAQLEELSGKTVGVDIDSGEATAQVDRIKTELDDLARKSPDVAVRADTARASAQLAEIQVQADELARKSPDIDVKVDTLRAAAELAAIQAEVDHLGSSKVNVNADDHGSIGSTIGKLTSLRSALGAAIVAALAISPAIAATIGAGLAGVGVIALGASGVSGAVKLLDQQVAAEQNVSATAAKSSAEQVAAAERVKNAQQSLADARYSADQQAITSAEQVASARQSLADAETKASQQQVQDARAVVSAEQQLTTANQSALNAQKALNDAREQAARDLLSSADSAVNANLSQKQAVLDLANAQSNLATVNGSSTSTDIAKQQAALDVAKAQEALIEANQHLAQATEDNNKAQAAGVNGAPAVVSAQQQLTSSVQAQQNAVQALGDAKQKQATDEVAAAESVQKAEQAVSDALRSQASQARSSAESIANAQQAIGDALRVQSQAGTSAASSLAKINAQLAKINPATLAFAKYIQNSVKPALATLKNTAAGGLLPGVEQALKNMGPLFKPFNDFIGTISKTLGNLAVEASKALTGPFWTQFFQFMTRNVGPMLETFGKIVGNLVTGFAGIIEGFQPVTDAIGQGLLHLSQKFADFGANISSSGGFRDYLDYLKQAGPVILDILGHLASILVKVADALAPVAVVALKGIDAFTALIDKIIGPLVQALLPALKLAFDGIRDAVQHVTDAIQSHHAEMQELWDFIKNYAIPLIGGALKLAFEILGDAIALAIDSIAATIDILNAIVGVGKSVGGWFAGPFVNFFTSMGSDIKGIFDGIPGFFEKAWSDVEGIAKKVGGWFTGSFVNFFRDMGNDIARVFGAIPSFVESMWNDVSSAVSRGVDFITQDIIDPFIDLLNRFLGIFGIKIHTIPPVNVPKPPPLQNRGANTAGTPFAAGGVLPGYTPGRDIYALPQFYFSGGEGILVPEATRALGGASGIAAINSRFSGRSGTGDGRHFLFGGILGGLENVLGDIVSGIRQVTATSALFALRAAEAPISAVLDLAPSQFARTLAHGVFNKTNSAVYNFIDGKTYDAGGVLAPGFTLAYNGTGRSELVAPMSTFDQVISRSKEISNGFALTQHITQEPGEDIGSLADRVIERAMFKQRAAGG